MLLLLLFFVVFVFVVVVVVAVLVFVVVIVVVAIVIAIVVAITTSRFVTNGIDGDDVLAAIVAEAVAAVACNTVGRHEHLHNFSWESDLYLRFCCTHKEPEQLRPVLEGNNSAIRPGIRLAATTAHKTRSR